MMGTALIDGNHIWGLAIGHDSSEFLDFVRWPPTDELRVDVRRIPTAAFVPEAALTRLGVAEGEGHTTSYFLFGGGEQGDGADGT
jgi:hypothetical protein